MSEYELLTVEWVKVLVRKHWS